MSERTGTLRTPRGDVAYSVQGQGPALVLLHPIGLDRSWWSDHAGEWQRRYTVFTVDLLGHGASAPLREPVTLREHARDVLALLAQEEVASAALVGVSMGGMVAQWAAVEAPHRVTALVLCATASSFPEAARGAIRARGDTSRAGAMAEVVEATLVRWFTSGAPRELVERCRQRLLADDWYSWSANWEAISQQDVAGRLAGIDLPVLVVAAGADASIPLPVSRQVAETTRGELVVVDDAAHLGAFEWPERFRQAFDRFIDRVHGFQPA